MEVDTLFVSNRFMSCEKLGSFLVLIEEIFSFGFSFGINDFFKLLFSFFFFIVRRIIRIMFILKYYLILNIFSVKFVLFF